MAKISSKKSVEDLEKQLLKKNKDLNAKYLELETLLDLTNTINSLEDLDELFFSVLSLSSSIINSSKGLLLLKNDISNIFDPVSVFNLDEKNIKELLAEQAFINGVIASDKYMNVSKAIKFMIYSFCSMILILILEFLLM